MERRVKLIELLIKQNQFLLDQGEARFQNIKNNFTEVANTSLDKNKLFDLVLDSIKDLFENIITNDKFVRIQKSGDAKVVYQIVGYGSIEKSDLKLYKNIYSNLAKGIQYGISSNSETNTHVIGTIALIKFRDYLLENSPEIIKYKLENEISLSNNDISEPPLFSLNFDVENNIQITNLLHSELNTKLINSSYSHFERHFINNKQKFYKLKWLGFEAEFKHLFKWLNDKKIMSFTHINKELCIHFINRFGNNFNENQLSQATSKKLFDDLEYIPSICHKVDALVLTFKR